MTTARPSFPQFLASVLALLAGSQPAAQDSVMRVDEGRDFRSHKLLSTGLTDVWQLDVHEGEMLWCVVESGEFDPVLELVDATGATLATNDGAGTRSELWRRAPTAGAYEFRVRAFEQRGGGNYQYSLHRFRCEPLGAAAEATHTFGPERWWHYRIALQAGDVLVPTVLGDGRLTAVLDTDRNPLAERHGGYRAARAGDVFVRIEGDAGRRAQIVTQLARTGERAFGERRAEHLPAYGLDAWRVPLPAGACVVFDLRMPAGELQFDALDAAPDDGGPAFVATGHFDKGGVRRRLLFVRRATTLAVTLRNRGSEVAPYELEVRAWGRAASIGEELAGELPLGDGALFHFDLPAGELVDIAAASTRFDARFDVWDPDGNVIAQADDRAPTDRDPRHRFLVGRPGTYHVLVHCLGGHGAGAFTLRADRAPLPAIAAGDVAAVQPGSHVHLALGAGESVWLSLRSATFDAALQVVDPAGDARFVAEAGGLGGDVLVAYRASHAGRHTLIVHARSGAGAGELRVVRP
jgi:hypothetical protein